MFRHGHCCRHKIAAVSVADLDPGSGDFLTPGSGMGKKNQDQDPGWTTRIIFLIAKKQFFGLEYLNSLMWIRDGKNSAPASGINIPDPQHWLLPEIRTLWCQVEIVEGDEDARAPDRCVEGYFVDGQRGVQLPNVREHIPLACVYHRYSFIPEWDASDFWLFINAYTMSKMNTRVQLRKPRQDYTNKLIQNPSWIK